MTDPWKPPPGRKYGRGKYGRSTYDYRIHWNSAPSLTGPWNPAVVSPPIWGSVPGGTEIWVPIPEPTHPPWD